MCRAGINVLKTLIPIASYPIVLIMVIKEKEKIILKDSNYVSHNIMRAKHNNRGRA